jgi:hypothetical protein
MTALRTTGSVLMPVHNSAPWVLRIALPVLSMLSFAVATVAADRARPGANARHSERTHGGALPVEQTDDQILELIRKLGDPSYNVRTRATRQLCMIGQRAAPALQRAADSDEFEIALRAKNLLEVIESVYFGGCRIHLASAQAKIAWDDPFELTVTIHNESAYRAALPLDMSAERRRAFSEQARLVGDIVDLADYLSVTGPDGRQVDLRVDDLRDDPQVADAIEWRAEGGPVGELPGGDEIVYHLRPLNRGWARYPLLKRGIYKIVFEYDPQWDDEEFRKASVGQVTSNVLEVQVTREAPPLVQRSRRPAVVDVQQDGAHFVARLTSSDDLPIWVNLNLGADQAPFAQLVWTIAAGSAAPVLEDVRFDLLSPPPRLDAFSRRRIRELAPGDSVELGRAPLAGLMRAKLVQGSPDGATFDLQATMVNQCDLTWQRGQQPSPLGNPRAPEALRTSLPRRMITGRFGSNPVTITKGGLQAASDP